MGGKAESFHFESDRTLARERAERPRETDAQSPTRTYRSDVSNRHSHPGRALADKNSLESHANDRQPAIHLAGNHLRDQNHNFLVEERR